MAAVSGREIEDESGWREREGRVADCIIGLLDLVTESTVPHRYEISAQDAKDLYKRNARSVHPKNTSEMSEKNRSVSLFDLTKKPLVGLKELTKNKPYPIEEVYSCKIDNNDELGFLLFELNDCVLTSLDKFVLAVKDIKLPEKKVGDMAVVYQGVRKIGGFKGKDVVEFVEKEETPTTTSTESDE